MGIHAKRLITMHNLATLDADGYTPGRLIDAVSRFCKARSDHHLARILGIYPTVISRVRSKKSSVSDSLMVRIHDITGMTIAEQRRLMGVEPVYQPIYKF